MVRGAERRVAPLYSTPRPELRVPLQERFSRLPRSALAFIFRGRLGESRGQRLAGVSRRKPAFIQRVSALPSNLQRVCLAPKSALFLHPL